MKLKIKLRISVYSLLIPLGILLFAGLILAFFPFSSKTIDREIQNRISAVFGQKAEIQKARFYLAQGRCIIYKISFESGYKIGSVEANFSVGELIKNKRLFIYNITIKKPSNLIFRYSPASFQLDESQMFILRALARQNGEKKHNGGVKVDLKNYRISDWGAALIPDDNFTSGAKILADNFSADVSLFGDEASEIRLNFKGNLNTHSPSPFKGFVLLNSGSKAADFTLILNHITQKENKPFKELPDFFAGNIHLKGNASYSAQSPTIKWEIDFGKVEVKDTQTAALLSDSDVRTTGTLTLSGENTFKACAFINSQKYTLEAAVVKDNPLSPERYSISLKTSKLLADAIPIIESRISFADVKYDLVNLKYDIDAKIGGELDKLGDIKNSSMIDVNLMFSGLNLQSDYLEGWVKDIAGAIHVTDGGVDFKNMRGNFKGIECALSGRLSGDKRFFIPKKLEMDWATKFRLENLLTHIEESGRLNLSGNKISGDISGKGNLSAKFKTNKNGKQYLSKDVSVNGKFSIAKGMINHSLLPSRVADIDGSFEFSNEKVMINLLKGKMGKSSVNLNGSIYGKKLFWINPAIDLGIESDIDVRDLLKFLNPGQVRNVLESVIQYGSAKSVTSIRGALLKPDLWEIKNESTIQSAYADLEKAGIKGKIENLSGKAVVDGKSISFSDVSARLNKIPFVFSGSALEDSIKINMKTEGFLEDMKKTFPEAFEDFIVEGKIKLTVDIDLAQKSSAANSAQSNNVYQGGGGAFKIFNRWMKIKDAANGADGDFNTNIEATLEADNATITQKYMPALIKNIKGVATFKDNKITMKDIRSDWGKSKDSIVSGVIDLSKGNLNIDFVLDTDYFDLEEWTSNWGSSPGKFIPDSDVTQTSPTKEIRGFIRAKKAGYGSITGSDFKGKFVYNYYEHDPNYFYFYDCETTAYDGRVKGEGTIRIPSGDPRYEITVDVKNMDAGKFLKAVRPDKDAITGILNAMCHLFGNGPHLEKLTGGGSLNIAKSKFIGSVIFKAIGKVLNLPLINEATFTSINSNYKIADGRLFFPDLVFNSAGIEMRANGYIYFSKQIDMEVYIAVLSSLFDKVPLLNKMSNWVTYLGTYILKFEIKGTIDEPKVATVPLSADKIKDIFGDIFTFKIFRLDKLF